MNTPDGDRLRIGFVPGVTLTKWRRIWADRFPRVPLEVVEVHERDQRRALVDGDVDMCFARLPLDSSGLHAIPLYEEQPVVWLSKDHVVSALDEVTTEDLADERVIHDAEPESIELATYSAAVLRVPMSVARSGSRRDMVYRPVTDAEPTTVVLAWRVDDENPWIEEFIGVVRGRTPNSSRTAQQREATGRKPPASDRGKKPTGGRRPGPTRRPRRR